MSKDQTVLFHSTVFGPIHSRRLGVSLGINLMPNDGKVCSFDCLYCEAGFNAQGTGRSGLPTRRMVRSELEQKLAAMRAEGSPLDVITFSGNGEPTLHPDFAGVIDDTIELRNIYYPQAKVSVLTNSTRAALPDVEAALRRVDNNIMKLDSAVESTMRLIDRPVSENFTVESVVKDLKQYGESAVIQTMILRGEHEGQVVDNTTPEEVEALIAAYKEIGPREVMLYSLDRSTPEERLVKVERDELERIAEQMRGEGINVVVS